MAEADCATCAACGYRSCDRCGAIVFDPVPERAWDLCGECGRGDQVDAVDAGDLPWNWPWPS